jgi:hypothetical protein
MELPSRKRKLLISSSSSSSSASSSSSSSFLSSPTEQAKKIKNDEKDNAIKHSDDDGGDTIMSDSDTLIQSSQSSTLSTSSKNITDSNLPLVYFFINFETSLEDVNENRRKYNEMTTLRLPQWQAELVRHAIPIEQKWFDACTTIITHGLAAAAMKTTTSAGLGDEKRLDQSAKQQLQARAFFGQEESNALGFYLSTGYKEIWKALDQQHRQRINPYKADDESAEREFVEREAIKSSQSEREQEEQLQADQLLPYFWKWFDRSSRFPPLLRGMVLFEGQGKMGYEADLLRLVRFLNLQSNHGSGESSSSGASASASASSFGSLIGLRLHRSRCTSTSWHPSSALAFSHDIRQYNEQIYLFVWHIAEDHSLHGVPIDRTYCGSPSHNECEVLLQPGVWIVFNRVERLRNVMSHYITQPTMDTGPFTDLVVIHGMLFGSEKAAKQYVPPYVNPKVAQLPILETDEMHRRFDKHRHRSDEWTLDQMLRP